MNLKLCYIELSHSLSLIAAIILYPILIIVSMVYTVNKFMRNIYRNKIIAGQVAVVTGSGRGLGREIAIELAKRGCHVAIVDIQGNLAEETSKYIADQFNVQTRGYKIDVTDYEQLVELKNKVTEDLGDITILINNAAILVLPSIENPSAKEIQQMVNVNFTSHIFAHQIFLPKMKELNKGHIVTISSIFALMGTVKSHVYSATKSAVRSLTSVLRMELMHENKNITATTVMPCFLATNKLVTKMVQMAELPIMPSPIDGDVAAKYIVNGMLNGEREITIPYCYLYLYKLFELLPICIKEKIGAFVVHHIKKAYEATEVKEIFKNSDVF